LDGSGLGFFALLRFGAPVSLADFAGMVGRIFPIELCGCSSF
jgi:hypothetical protein